jgi:hypothetical protein
MLKGYWKRFWAILTGYRKPLGNAKYQLLAKRRGGRIAQQLSAKKLQFPSLFSEALCFCSHALRVEGAVEDFKNAQWFFS